MKLVLFGDFQLGVMKGDRIVDVGSAATDIKHCSPQQLMEGVIASFDKLKPLFQKIVDKSDGVPADSVRIRAPLPRPTKIICARGNYGEFGQKEAPSELDAFLKSPEAVIGNGDIIDLPPDLEVKEFQHEAELAVVIGKRATRVSAADAMNYVFGYVPFIDVSARGHDPGGKHSFFLRKSFDTFAPIGPCVVSKDEIPEPNNLSVKLWVNQELRQDYNTSDMSHYIPEFVAFCSFVTTLMPGDVLATGTNHQQLSSIQDGDDLSLEISGLGRMTVHVRDELKRTWARGISEASKAKALGRQIKK